MNIPLQSFGSKDDGFQTVLELTKPPSLLGDPTWEVAFLFPPRGQWTEADYFGLNTNLLVELSEGCLEVLPMPTMFHQLIAQFLFKLLDAFVLGHALGKVFIAPLPVRLWPGKLREPDVIFLRSDRIRDLLSTPNGADLVMEVLSEGLENRKRDLETKRGEYAKAGIAEYWLVDPQEQSITILILDEQVYRVHGVYRLGDVASSVGLPGFSVAVEAVFAAARN